MSKRAAQAATTLLQLEQQVIACTLCPRLRAYCKHVGRVRKPAFASDEYWARPVPGFGDAQAHLLIVGLAPAAHGANRTGRMFTGDGSDGAGAADFLARALHGCGYASQPHSRQRGDGFELQGAYLTAIARCAPPGNKPLPLEVKRCALWLHRELQLLKNVRVVLALGGLAFAQLLRVLPEHGVQLPRARFGHGVQVQPLGAGPLLIGSYHPSRQNTQTGRLTPDMLADVLRAARLAARA